MSNSAKQRSFIKELIKHLKEIGLEVVIDRSKHFILSIIFKDRKRQVSISCSPKNRASAQRAAISDVKRVIAELDESIARTFNSEGLLQMITINNQSMKNEPLPDYEGLRAALKKKDLNGEMIDDIIDAVKAAIQVDNAINGKAKESDSVHDGQSTSSGITVLTPEGKIPAQCSHTVAVHAREQKNRARAYSLKKSLQALTDYYKACIGMTKLGVIVTDVWRPSELSAFEVELDFYDANGIQTLIILKSNTSLHLVNFPWR